MNSKKNIGVTDRVARILVGLVSLSVTTLAFIGPRTPIALLGLVGIIPLIAGIIGYCPPYKWVGINTHKG